MKSDDLKNNCCISLWHLAGGFRDLYYLLKYNNLWGLKKKKNCMSFFSFNA